jgi:hypothetical protein
MQEVCKTGTPRILRWRKLFIKRALTLLNHRWLVREALVGVIYVERCSLHPASRYSIGFALGQRPSSPCVSQGPQNFGEHSCSAPGLPRKALICCCFESLTTNCAVASFGARVRSAQRQLRLLTPRILGSRYAASIRESVISRCSGGCFQDRMLSPRSWSLHLAPSLKSSGTLRNPLQPWLPVEGAIKITLRLRTRSAALPLAQPRDRQITAVHTNGIQLSDSGRRNEQIGCGTREDGAARRQIRSSMARLWALS